MTTNTDTSRLCWVDVETTGLDPDDEILELGMIVTDAVLVPLAVLHVFFAHDLDRLRMSRWAWKTHTENGLLDELVRRKDERICTRHHDIEVGDALLPGLSFERGAGEPSSSKNELAWFLDRWASGCPLAGSSVHFDRAVLNRYWPETIAKHLHYRNVDVSTYRETLRRWCPDVGLPPKGERHRVLDDLLASIEVAKVVRELLVGPEQLHDVERPQYTEPVEWGEFHPNGEPDPEPKPWPGTGDDDVPF